MCRLMQCKPYLWPSLCVLCLSLVGACSSQPEKQPQSSRETSTNFICGGSYKDADWVCTEQAKTDSVQPPVKFSEYQAAEAQATVTTQEPVIKPQNPPASAKPFPVFTAPPLADEQKPQKSDQAASTAIKPSGTTTFAAKVARVKPATTKATTTKPAAASPLGEALQEDQNFLLQQPSDSYTIQVAALRIESHARDYAANNGLEDALIARTISKGDLWYIVLSSTFPDYQSAEQEATYLRESGKLQTWIRPLSSLQKAIERAQNAK